jgi:small-conductance mechanosensitive channel
MDSRWIGAIGAIVAGLLVGAVAGFWARRRLTRATDRPVLSSLGSASGAFLFWFFTAVGVVFAIGAVSPETLRPIPRQVLGYLPRVLAAGLILLIGYAAAGIAGGLLGGALGRATGRPQRELDLGVRYTVVVLAIILALAQLGVNVTIVTVLVGAMALTIGAAIAMLIGLGGRQLASELAAGRYLRRHLQVGSTIDVGDYRGTIVALHPATIEINEGNGSVVHAPYSMALAVGPRLADGATD